MAADLKINVFLISRTLKALQMSAYDPIRKETGLSQMELQIAFTIYHFPGGSTVGSIHKQTGFNKGQISVSVSNLVKHGYLEKTDTKGSNVDVFALSEKGFELTKRIEKNTSHGRKKLLKGFTKEELNNCADYLDRIFKNAEELKNKIKFE